MEGLIRTFNALLMIARAESGQARDNMSEFDAAEVARGVGELYEPLAEEKGLSLKVEAPSPVPVHGNRELVSQALANLVDNAIKYAASAERADKSHAITVKAASEGDRVLLSVIDQGPGIPESMRERVVERFVRLDQSRTVPGSGLGLSLVAAVARLHGGELRFEDNAPGPCGRRRAAARRTSGGGMTAPVSKEKPDPSAALASRITGSPIAAGQDTNRPNSRIGSPASATATPSAELRAVLASHPAAQAMLSSLAHFSPYLWDLASSDASRLLAHPAVRSGHPSRRLLADTAARVGTCRQ